MQFVVPLFGWAVTWVLATIDYRIVLWQVRRCLEERYAKLRMICHRPTSVGVFPQNTYNPWNDNYSVLKIWSAGNEPLSLVEAAAIIAQQQKSAGFIAFCWMCYGSNTDILFILSLIVNFTLRNKKPVVGGQQLDANRPNPTTVWGKLVLVWRYLLELASMRAQVCPMRYSHPNRIIPHFYASDLPRWKLQKYIFEAMHLWYI